MSSTFLTRTAGSAVTAERKKYTISVWVKRSTVGVEHAVCSAGNGGGSEEFAIRFDSTDKLNCFHWNGSSMAGQLITNRLFRDVNAWYHIYFVYDSANSTQADRFMLYINGERETSFSTNTGLTQNDLSPWNVDERHQIGSNSWNNSGNGNAMFDGVMSHFYNVAGSHIAVTEFGSTDSTTGEWKINTSPTISSYGTDGFLVLKDGNTATDQSTNSNNFTVSGTLTKTEDCPSNVFCTWNPLYRSARKDMTLTNGNTFIFEQNSGDSGVSGTIGVSSGKYYWEQIVAQVNGTNAAITGGLHTTEDWNESPTDAMAANTVGMRSNGNVWKGTTDLGNFTTATYNGDIIGVGFDADNGSMYFWRNGTALNSGNAIITGMDMTKTWIPFGVQHGGARVTTSTNFGNGYFQTTAVSSAGTNASGIGIFEYDVPTGYTALSTKGLNL